QPSTLFPYTTLFRSTVAIGGTLGILIPPSTALIIVAVQAEQSIATLFRVALGPGLMITALLIITAVIIAKIKPHLAPTGERHSLDRKSTRLNSSHVK